jgi:hypothetical protein
MDIDFSNWLEARIRHDVSQLDPDQSPPPAFTPEGKPHRDGAGLPTLQRGGFRKNDAKMVHKSIPIVDEKLTRACSNATKTVGVDWLCIYLPPKPDMKTIDDPEKPYGANSVRDAKIKGKEGWDAYEKYSKDYARQQLDKWIAEEGVNTASTVVYIKPTSRVHTLTPWQMQHNKGHAIWGSAREGILPIDNILNEMAQFVCNEFRVLFEADEQQAQGEVQGVVQAAANVAANGPAKKKILSKFIQVMREMIDTLHKQNYSKEGRAPTAKEMTVMMSRILPIGASFRRILMSNPDDPNKRFDKPEFKINTALSNFMEAMFDLIAIWLNAGGRIPLKTSGAIQPQSRSQNSSPIVQDRSQAIPQDFPARREVERHFAGKVRPYVWEPIVENEKWQEYSLKLSDIVADAIRACVWDRVGGPIYATHGFLTTGA